MIPSYADVPDELLMHAYADTADEQAFLELYRRYNDRLESWVRRRWLQTPETAEDVVAETWVRVVANAWRFDSSQGRVQSWIFTIAGNLSKNALRLYRRQTQFVNMSDLDYDYEKSRPKEYVDESNLGPDAFLEAQNLARASAWSLMMIPPMHRDVLLQRLFGQSTYARLATDFGLAEGTVKSRLHRGRRIFSTALPIAEDNLYNLRGAVEQLPPVAFFRWARETYPDGYEPSPEMVAFLMREHTGEAVPNPFPVRTIHEGVVQLARKTVFALPRPSDRLDTPPPPDADGVLDSPRYERLYEQLVADHNNRRTEPLTVLRIRTAAEQTPSLTNGGRTPFLREMHERCGVGTSVVSQVIRGTIYGVTLGPNLHETGASPD
jgi:RNA polymerase sigma-70 factor (ECF subfamily)